MVDFSVFEYEYHSLSRLCVCGVAPGDRSQIKILYIYTGRNLYIYIYIYRITSNRYSMLVES
jgi:hypothetical protein